MRIDRLGFSTKLMNCSTYNKSLGDRNGKKLEAKLDRYGEG